MREYLITMLLETESLTRARDDTRLKTPENIFDDRAHPFNVPNLFVDRNIYEYMEGLRG